MSPESVDSTKKKPSNRSQPQISAKFPRLGTRFPKKDGVQHGKTCKTQKGQSPTRENMPSQKARASHSKTSDHGNTRSLIPKGTQASEKPIELKRYIRPEKGDARSRKHAIKKRCTIHHANQKMDGDWHRCLYKTHFVFHKPDLRKIGDDCSIKIGRRPAPAPKTKRLCPPGIRWQHPKWDPRPTKKAQRRRLEKSLGRDSKPPESQLPYNRQPPPRQRSSKVARAP